MNGRFGAVLLVLAAVFGPALGTVAQDVEITEDFCSLLESDQLALDVAEVEAGVVLTFATAGDREALYEQAQRLAERALARHADGFAPAAGLGDWDLWVPAALVRVTEDEGGVALTLTDSQIVGIAAIRAWATHVVRVLAKGDCRDLLERPAGDV